MRAARRLVLMVCALAPVLRAQPAPNLKDSKLVSEGEALFAKNCSVPYCHGREGTTGRAPALRDRAWQVKELRETIARGVPNSAMPNWDDKLSDRQIWAVAAYILSISAEVPARATPPAGPPPPAPAPAADLPESLVGSAARGEEIFFQPGERGCAVCHTIDGKGNSVGPDLTGAARREARDLFRAIVFPGARVDPGRPLLGITMKDGEKISALKHEETASALRVYDLASLPPALRRLPKDQIQSIEPQRRPAMPARYGEIYTLRQLLDIVSFLKSSGAPAAARVTFLDIQ